MVSTEVNGVIGTTITDMTKARLPPVERAAYWP
jgi:hypothetical protein